jgi:diacylglycerol kinase (ATP)
MPEATPPQPRRVFVAINPTASFGKGKDVGPAVIAALESAGHTVTALQEPSYAALILSVRKAVGTKPDALVVVGGDGMVNLAANILVGTTVPLGIVPSGTGNDMARTLGIPFDKPDAAIAMLLEALTRPARVIDAGVIHGPGHDRYFACSLSAGFDAIVNERANRMSWPKGPQRYNLAIALELLRLKPITYRLELDGETRTVQGMLVTVGNGISIGGGMNVTPNAQLDDGLFDVLVVGKLTRLQFLRIFPSVYKGTHLSDKRVSVVRAKRVTIDADAVVAYADGERVGPLPLDIEVVPGALRVLS